jgi:hypothetical protein
MSIIGSLTNRQSAGLTATAMSQLTTSDIAALSTTQISALNATQINALGTADLQALSATQMTGFSAKATLKNKCSALFPLPSGERVRVRGPSACLESQISMLLQRSVLAVRPLTPALSPEGRGSAPVQNRFTYCCALLSDRSSQADGSAPMPAPVTAAERGAREPAATPGRIPATPFPRYRHET